MKIKGLPVEDAKRPVTLHISKRDVTLGDTKDPAVCAAARACVRTVDGCSEARVHLGRVYLRQGDKWIRYQTPQSLRAEIIAFDRGGRFEPGVYRLAVPYPMEKIRKIVRSGSDTNRNKPGSSKTKSHRKSLSIRHVTTNVRPHGANK